VHAHNLGADEIWVFVRELEAQAAETLMDLGFRVQIFRIRRVAQAAETQMVRVAVSEATRRVRFDAEHAPCR
jgi:hypothetical protein